MAKHKRKPAKGKPITSHQLFPAVVALWFGAAFGLGSLAVRPSLLEGLVLKSHLDLIVPAAAPPLGVTARILVALVLAALGAVLGLIVASRIARPKPVVTERKRQGRGLGRDEESARPHYADASTRPPVLVREDTGEPFGGGVLANRRRSLAIEHEEEDFVPHDVAPLPGGNPQVFDISQLGIGAVEPTPEPAPVTATEPFTQAPASAPVSLDWSNAAPVPAPAAPIDAPTAIETQRQVFQAEALAAEPALAAACPATVAAHADGRQVFGITPPAPPSEGERQIFGVAAVDGHVSQEFVQAAGFKTSVFDLEQPEPLFAAREAEPAPIAAPIPQAFEPAPAGAPQAFEPAQAPTAAAPAPVVDEPLPSPGSLGMTDLAARLAESMRRRRAARAAPVEEPAAAPVATQSEPAPTAPPAIPVAFEAPASEVQDEAAVAFEPAPAVAPVAIPAAYEPPATPTEPAPITSVEVPAAPPLPRAMQPLALDAFIEDDALPDPSLLPPRHIAMPVAPVAAAEPVAQPSQPEPAPLELGAEEELAEEASYASLLEVTPVRNPFVRIEEPEVTGAEAEPVVIFPGQAPVQPAPVQPAAFAAAPGAAPFRRFDAPGAAEQGQVVAANLATPAVDPAEADRALRAALSNLQRMSGAA